ncbi:MAG: type VII secretion protein EssC [Candidatus Epulonipiscioides saccharophilum]|nr:MAG: type VII secretion protein EssC [Epulopiscium sp. AS2M-Bin001]
MDFILRLFMRQEIRDLRIIGRRKLYLKFTPDGSVIVLAKQTPQTTYAVSVRKGQWVLENLVTKKAKIEVLRGIVALGDATLKLSITVYAFNPHNIYQIKTPPSGRLLIGRGERTDIMIKNKLVSDPHLELNYANGEWSFLDTNSSNGTYINDKKLSSGIIKKDDVVKFAFCQILIDDSDIMLITEDIVMLQYNSQILEQRFVDSVEQPYPLKLNRSPRLKRNFKKEIIEIQAPPVLNNVPKINWLSVFLGPLLSILAITAIVFFMPVNEGQSRNFTMLYYTVPMSVIGIVMGFLNFMSQKNKHKQTEEVRRIKYQEYLATQVDKIEALLDMQREILVEDYPSVTECVMLALRRENRLWNRTQYDNDFMTLSLGTGAIPAEILVKVPRQTISLVDDPLLERTKALEHKFDVNYNCPILMDLGVHKSCGIIGDRGKSIQLAKNLIMQAATFHSYLDLKIVIISDLHEAKEWEFAKWLPHTFDKNRGRRYFATNKQHANIILNDLKEELIQFNKESQNEDKYNRQVRDVAETPHYLFVCAAMETCINHAIFPLLINSKLKLEYLFLFNEIHMLPPDCHYIADFSNRKALFYTKSNASEMREFSLEYTAKFEKFARSLAPLRFETSDDVLKLPDRVTYLEGYGVQKASELPIAKLWTMGRPEKSMSVPIGISGNGELFEFDIHEKKCGPHGLVAGMTGSGKSEMVQSWILSMATYFSPSSVNFVLIDFKGTGLILPFKNMPHLAGTISNIDKNIGRNLVALERELSRRQQLFNACDVQNITQYLTAYREGKVTEPLPYLFIVIDEFAEFKIQFPDFMRVIDSVFGIGRTLGVHVILLTQKPGNVVTDKMNSNTRFRWCLKVASSADSNDMIKRPDAAKIMRPGRAYVKVGEDEIFEQTQSFWSGAPYNPNRTLTPQMNTDVSLIDNIGQRAKVIVQKKKKVKTGKTEIDAVIDYLKEYTRQNSIPMAMQVWTEKMPFLMYLENILEEPFAGSWPDGYVPINSIIGMVDDPRNQSQYPLKLDLSKKGHALIYGSPGSGKTTLMQTIIISLAMSYSPKNVHIYIMDFGGGSLGMFKQIPHVGGIALGDEAEKITKLSEMIMEELKNRKKLFAVESVLSISSYREATGRDMPDIVLMLDNFAPILSTYPDLSDFFGVLTREGSSYGIYAIITGNNMNTISYRITQNVSQVFCLIMPDKSEYTAIVGRTDGVEPENTPGRGMLKDNPPLEFQIALPFNSENESKRASGIKDLAIFMDDVWSGTRPKIIPTMPEIVYSKDYPSENIFFGLTYTDYEPIYVDIKVKQYLTMSVKKKDPKLFKLFCDQIIKKVNYDEYLIYADNTINMESVIIDSVEFDSAIETWIPILSNRLEEFKKGPLDEKEHPFMVLAIYDLETCFEKATDKTMRRLNTIVNLGVGLNIIVFLHSTASSFVKLFNAGDLFTTSMVNKRCGLVYGGSASDHSVFKLNLLYSETKNEISSEDGYMIMEDRTPKIKLLTT